MSRVLITGATSGLGLAIAESFIKAGYETFLVGRKDRNIRSLLKRGGTFVRKDLRSLRDLKQICALVRRARIDCVVSNAGVYSNEDVAIRMKDSKQLLDTNLLAPVLLINEVYKQYRDRKSGTIVSINSIAGLSPNFSEAVYSASKHGLSGYIKSLQLDAYKHNIRIFDYYPGAIQTPITRKRAGYEFLIRPEDLADQVVADVMVKRTCFPVFQVIRRTPEPR